MKYFQILLLSMFCFLSNQESFAKNPDGNKEKSNPVSPDKKNTKLFTTHDNFKRNYNLETLNYFIEKYSRNFVNETYWQAPPTLPQPSFKDHFNIDLWGNPIVSGGTGNNTAGPFDGDQYDPTRPPEPSSGTGNNYGPNPSSGSGNNFQSAYGPVNGGDFNTLEEKAIKEGKISAYREKTKTVTNVKIKLIRATLINLLKSRGEEIYPNFKGKYHYKKNKTKITKSNGDEIQKDDVVSLDDLVSTLERDDVFYMTSISLFDRGIRRVDAANFPSQAQIKFPTRVVDLFHWKALYVLALHEVMNLHDIEVYNPNIENDKFIESFKIWDYIHEFIPCTIYISDGEQKIQAFEQQNVIYGSIEEEYYSLLKSKLPKKLNQSKYKELFPRKCHLVNDYSKAQYAITLAKLMKLTYQSPRIFAHENSTLLVNGTLLHQSTKSYDVDEETKTVDYNSERGDELPPPREILDLAIEGITTIAQKLTPFDGKSVLYLGGRTFLN